MSDSVTPSDVPGPTQPRSADRARYWQDTLAAFATSGQTVCAFCRARGLHEKRFYTWRRDLGLSPVARSTQAASDAIPARGFIPVRLVSDPR
jgi:hypothetical protein